MSMPDRMPFTPGCPHAVPFLHCITIRRVQTQPSTKTQIMTMDNKASTGASSSSKYRSAGTNHPPEAQGRVGGQELPAGMAGEQLLQSVQGSAPHTHLLWGVLNAWDGLAAVYQGRAGQGVGWVHSWMSVGVGVGVGEWEWSSRVSPPATRVSGNKPWE
jgi:hypothetical protein